MLPFPRATRPDTNAWRARPIVIAAVFMLLGVLCKEQGTWSAVRAFTTPCRSLLTLLYFYALFPFFVPLCGTHTIHASVHDHRALVFASLDICFFPCFPFSHTCLDSHLITLSYYALLSFFRCPAITAAAACAAYDLLMIARATPERLITLLLGAAPAVAAGSTRRGARTARRQAVGPCDMGMFSSLSPVGVTCR